LIVVVLLSGCGKKGPPLPPLVKLPAAPENLIAQRRGDTVHLQFTVPATNTDGTRPANVANAEVYAITAPQSVATPMTDEQLVKLATKVGGVRVQAPRNPNLTADADNPADEVEAPEGPGLPQGSVAYLEEALTPEILTLVEIPADPDAPAANTEANTPQPLVGPPPDTLARIYAAAGTSTRGRKGPLSPRVVVPLVPLPPRPSSPALTYDESSITLAWPALATGAEQQAAEKPADPGAVDPSQPVLPSRPIGYTPPAITYVVYDVSGDAPVKLTTAPIAEPRYTDTRIAWGEKRCYTVRAAMTIAGSTIESDAPPATCDVLVDTFAPAPPKGVAGIASEGAINLIWEPSTEKDLAGYIVLRAAAPSEDLQPITPAPIQETTFRDGVAPGVAYLYTVKAVDRAGNTSAASARVAETAR
jgi:predicted small lipoprotein YifL